MTREEGLPFDLSWLDERVAGCAWPRTDADLAAIAAEGVACVVNLREHPNAPDALRRHGLREEHIPVPDFTAPTQEQIERGVAAIEAALAAGERIAVHCGAGLGRTGTFLACRLVHEGMPADEAMARVRALRPGSIETPAQEAAVTAYADRGSQAGEA